MSESKRFGPVQVKFNDDGTLAIYQPDANRALSAELAAAMIEFYIANYRPVTKVAGIIEALQSTVGGGVITTSDGPVDVEGILASLPEEFNDPGEDRWGGANLDLGERYDLTDTEREADKNAAEAREAGKVETAPVTPAKRRPGRPRKQP